MTEIFKQDLINNMKKTLYSWIPMAVAVILLAGFAYTLVQQDIRLGANEPQAAYEQEILSRIDSGQDPKSINLVENVDLAKSLNLFVIIYDRSGRVINTNAYLEGKTPQLP